MNRIKMFGAIIILAFVLTGCGNQAKSYYNTAMKNYNKGEYEVAAENFAKAIELKDDRADYYIDYGFCLVALERYDEAKTMFERAILDKDNSIVNKNNKKAYRGLGIMYYQEGDYENARSMFTQAMTYNSLNDYNVDILSYSGSTNLKLGNYEAAVTDFTSVLEDEPKNVTALLSRGQANEQLGNYEDSMNDYLAAKALDTKNYEIYLALYDVYTLQGNSTEAAAMLEEATNIEVKDDKDKFYLAVIQYKQGNLAQAMDGFLAASEAGIVESSYYLGDIYLAEEDYESALKYLNQYNENVTSKDAAFYDKLAICYYQMESYDEMLDSVETGLSYATSVEKQALLRNEIIAYEYLGDFETAYAKMETYVSLYPEDEDAAKDFIFLETRQNNTSISDDSQEADDTDEIIKP